MRFSVLAPTLPGEYIYLVGSIPALGGWDVNLGLRMDASEYGSDAPLWFVLVEGLDGGVEFEYKYFRRGEEGRGTVIWEEGMNREGVGRDAVGGVSGCGNGRVTGIWRGGR